MTNTLNKIKEAYDCQAEKYICAINEMREDLSIFSEQVVEYKKSDISNRLMMISALLRCATEHTEKLMQYDGWEKE